MAGRARRLLSVLMVATASASPGFAGAQDWVVTAAAGRVVQESLGSRAGTLGATMSLVHDGPLALYLAGGAPFDSSGIFWGAAGVGGRLLYPARLLSAGIDATADAVTFADASWDMSGWGSSIEVMPLVRLENDATAVELRTGLKRFQQSYGGLTDERTLHMSDALFAISTSIVRVDGELRYARTRDDDFPFAGVTAQYRDGAVGAWGEFGHWFGSQLSGTGWGLGLQLSLPPVGDLFASYTQEGWDPLYRNAPRRSWNVGLSRRIGPGSSLAGPLTSPEVRNGNAHFSVMVEAAPGPISIAGDFTGWETVAMDRTGGEWVVALPVSSGVHRYAYLDGNGDWFVPSTVSDRVDDGFGGESAVLVVP